MPNKVVEAIKAAWEATQEIMNPLSISIDAMGTEVHVVDIRDLEQVSGLLEFTPFGEKYPYRAHKKLESVTFFCLLTQEEYKAVKMEGSELGLGAAAWRYDMHGERGLAAGGSRGVKGPRERGREGKTQARYAPNDGNS